MNLKQAVAIVVLVTVPFFVAAAQHEHDVQSADTAKSHVMPNKMGKATFEKYLDGYHLQVWLIAQEDHKKMMKDTMMARGMRHDMKGMDHKNMEAMMSGTHHVMVMFDDTAKHKPAQKTEIEVMTQSPSKKSASVKLTERMGHFGGALTLDEKGEYLVMIHAKVAGAAHYADFRYTVK